jgi:hypothetical protein
MEDVELVQQCVGPPLSSTDSVSSNFLADRNGGQICWSQAAQGAKSR